MTGFDSRDSFIIRRVSFDVVEQCFEEESNLFDVAWTRFVSGHRLPSDITGLPIQGGEPGDSYTPFVIMTVAAVCESLLTQDVRVGLPEILAAVQSAARNLKVPEEQVVRLAEAIAPRLHRAFVTLQGPANAGQLPESSHPSDRLWAEWWLDGSLIEAEQVKYESIIQDSRTERAMFLVDEHRGELRGPKTCRGFDDPELDFRAFTALWLTLDRTGSHYSYADIEKQRPSSHEDPLDSTLRKYVKAAQSALEELIGEPVIPKPRDGRYYIKADSWSWCWIRKNHSRDKSILLST